MDAQVSVRSNALYKVSALISVLGWNTGTRRRAAGSTYLKAGPNRRTGTDVAERVGGATRKARGYAAETKGVANLAVGRDADVDAGPGHGGSSGGVVVLSRRCGGYQCQSGGHQGGEEGGLHLGGFVGGVYCLVVVLVV